MQTSAEDEEQDDDAVADGTVGFVSKQIAGITPQHDGTDARNAETMLEIGRRQLAAPAVVLKLTVSIGGTIRPKHVGAHQDP